MMGRDAALCLFDPDSSDDYVPLHTEVNGWALAVVSSQRPPADIRSQALPPAAGAATGPLATRRRLLALRLCCAIATIAADAELRPRRVVALTNAAVARFSVFAPPRLSLYCIAEPAPSVRPDQTDAAGTVLPLDLLLLI